MDKNIKISILCQIYGKLLTEKQYQVLDDYYNNDLSLSEIAENLNISRTAVFNAIKNVTEKLTEYEEKLKLLQKQTILKETIDLEDITKIKQKITNILDM